MSGSRSSASKSSPSSTSAANRRLARQIDADLQRHRDPNRAAAEKAYLKSNLGFIGVGLPVMREIVRASARERVTDRESLMTLVELLWEEPIFEKRMIAVLLLEARRPMLRSGDIRVLERLIRESKTWAFVDELAIAITGGLVEHNPGLNSVLDRWSHDDDFWVRRSSMLALLPPLRRGQGDFVRFAGYAERMLDEKEFFIRKAIGWVLRETSKRRPDLVFDWLLPRAARASGVTVREAVKYLSPAQRAAVLAAYASGKRSRLASGRAPR